MKFRMILHDNTARIKVKCPSCDVWGVIAGDQFQGEVSLDCLGCDFNGTLLIEEWATFKMTNPTAFNAEDGV